jgi:hypothetical protein
VSSNRRKGNLAISVYFIKVIKHAWSFNKKSFQIIVFLGLQNDVYLCGINGLFISGRAEHSIPFPRSQSVFNKIFIQETNQYSRFIT